MKKVFFSLFFIAFFLFPAYAGFQVDSVNMSAEAADSGRTQVTMAVQLTFDAPAESVTIPLPDGQVSRVSVVDYHFDKETDENGTDLVLTKKGGFAGTQTFFISYTVPYDGTVGSYTLDLLSSRWALPVGACSFQVVMPRAFEETPQVLSGYHGALPLGETSLSVAGTTISGAVSSRMAYDTLSVSLEVPEDYFEVRSATIPGISITFLAVGMLAVWLLTAVYWRQKLRTPRSQTAQRLLAPEGVLACQLPMALDGSTCDVAAMVLEWANLGYLSLSLSKNGTLVLTRLMQMGTERSRAERQLFSRIFAKRGRVAATPGRFSAAAARFRAASRKSLYRVIFDRKGGNPVLVQLPCRVLLAVGIGYTAYRLLPEGGGFVVLAALFGLAGLIYSIVLHTATMRLCALGRTSPSAWLCWLAALFLLGLSLVAGALPEMLVGLGACLFSGIATAPGPRRSARGMDAMAQAKGCRAFYRNVSWNRLQVLQEKNSRFFQNQLPYAAALGVDRRFAKRFERLAIPMPEWLALPGNPLRSAQALQKQLRPILKQLRAAFR